MTLPERILDKLLKAEGLEISQIIIPDDRFPNNLEDEGWLMVSLLVREKPPDLGIHVTEHIKSEDRFGGD